MGVQFVTVAVYSLVYYWSILVVCCLKPGLLPVDLELVSCKGAMGVPICHCRCVFFSLLLVDTGWSAVVVCCLKRDWRTALQCWS